MINQRVQEVVENSDPRKEIALIVTVRAEPDRTSLRRLSDRGSRRQFVTDFYSNAKARVVASLATMAGDGVRVVNSLDGTGSLVVAAPAQAWRRVLRDAPPALKDEDVTVDANEPTIGLP